MADRIILHCDLNNFFASVTLLSNPTLYDMPVAICGSVEERHGIVLAKNENAKKFGVKTAETIWQAKAKCPNLITLPPNYKKYEEYSKAAQRIYAKYTDLIEPFGIDECWLDVTGSQFLFGDGETLANRIRADIRENLGITASVGVSFNKVFAKLGSDLKKPDATTVISRENFKSLVWPLDVSQILFVGKSTAKKLNDNGIFTLGDVAGCNLGVLTRLLGKNGAVLKTYAEGNDTSPVVTPQKSDLPKSVGRSVTPGEDIKNESQAWEVLLELADDISRQLHNKNIYAGGVQVHTRDTSLCVKEFSGSLARPSNSCVTMAKKGMELLKANYKWNLPLRSLGIRAINIKNDNIAFQQDIFGAFDGEERQENIENSINGVRDRFGVGSIKRGRNIKND